MLTRFEPADIDKYVQGWREVTPARALQLERAQVSDALRDVSPGIGALVFDVIERRARLCCCAQHGGPVHLARAEGHVHVGRRRRRACRDGDAPLQVLQVKTGDPAGVSADQIDGIGAAVEGVKDSTWNVTRLGSVFCARVSKRVPSGAGSISYPWQ